jgi:hypothetical protein
LVIDADLLLPELAPARGRLPADVVIRRASVRLARSAPARRHEWRLPDGTRWASIAAHGDEHVFEFMRFAQFVVAKRGRSIRWQAPAATKPETIRHLLLDQVLPAVALEHQLIGLHASAVVINGEGVAFAGPASRGKSTIAASFALAGHAIVSDDSLMLQWRRRRLRAVPSYPSIRLWTETAARLFGPTSGFARVAEYTSKLRVGPRGAAIAFRREPVPVRRLYLIERRRGPARIDVLSSREAYIELLKITFRLDPADRAAARREVSALAALAQSLRVATLRVPPRLESLAAVRRAVLADVREPRQ